MEKDFGIEKIQDSTTIKKYQKSSGTTMFTILFVLFTLIVGVTAGLTYSGFQSTAESDGTLDFYSPIYNITLDNANATTNGTSTIYEKYVIGVFKNKIGEVCTNEITASENNINVPIRAYTVSFNTGGGSACANQTVTYTFNGYYTATTGGAQLINSSGYKTNSFTATYFSANSTIYAQWASGSTTLPTSTRDGYNFKGWDTDSGATIGSYAGGSSYTTSANVTLYAIWESIDITIPVTDTTGYYYISGSLYSRSSAYYKCSVCNNYSTSSTGTGCYHNYSTTAYYCSACDTYSPTSRATITCSSRNHSYATGTYWYCTYENKYVTSSSCTHYVLTGQTYHACSTTQTCGTCNGKGGYYGFYCEDGVHILYFNGGEEACPCCDMYLDECCSPFNVTQVGRYVMYCEEGGEHVILPNNGGENACDECDMYLDECCGKEDTIWTCPTCDRGGTVTCTTCGGSGYYYTDNYAWVNYAEPAYYCSVCGGVSRNSSGTGCYHYNATRYKCSYCNGYSTTSGVSGSCSSHNHSYNTSTLYYDYARQYGSGTSSISKSSASYSNGYYWSTTYGALKIGSTFSYTDGYTYRIIQITSSTSLKARRET